MEAIHIRKSSHSDPTLFLLSLQMDTVFQIPGLLERNPSENEGTQMNRSKKSFRCEKKGSSPFYQSRSKKFQPQN